MESGLNGGNCKEAECLDTPSLTARGLTVEAKVTCKLTVNGSYMGYFQGLHMYLSECHL